jgi:transposase InsO family protein
MQIVEQTKRRSGWRVYRTLAALGVPRSVYYAWKSREDLQDRTAKPCRVYEVLPEERAAICEFALQYPKIGYRKLTWMMVDAQQWHVDCMYVWVAARFYFLVSFVDAYSRYIVHHKLLMSLDGQSMAIELQAALEAAQGVKPRVVHDHGSEFVNRDVAAVIKAHNLIDIKTRPRHPESNGIVERFNGTVRDETDNNYGSNYLQAEAIIAKLMQHYNEERLHATLGYMTPATWHRGQPDEVRNERERRIAAARAQRRMTNQQIPRCPRDSYRSTSRSRQRRIHGRPTPFQKVRRLPHPPAISLAVKQPPTSAAACGSWIPWDCPSSARAAARSTTGLISTNECSRISAEGGPGRRLYGP